MLGAHLESNFINPDYQGAQPARCLRLPPQPGEAPRADGAFTGAAILAVIDAHRTAVRIVTLAPELPGGLDLVRRLAAAGHLVSLGHSAATYDQGVAAIAAGARHATHLFNRMPPLSHRVPGLVGAVLDAGPEVTCEVIGDGYHVHAAMVRLAVRAKGASSIAGNHRRHGRRGPAKPAPPRASASTRFTCARAGPNWPTARWRAA